MTASTIHPRPWSLRRRLAWQLTVAAGAVLSLLFVLLDTLIDREIYAHLDQGLALRANVIAHTLQQQGADLPLPDYREDGHTEFFTVYARDGRVLATSPNSRGLTLPRPPSQDCRIFCYYDARLPDGHPGRLLARALDPSDPAQGLLVTGTERTHWDAVERRVHGLLIGGIGLALLAVIGLGVWLVGRSFGLLDQLRAQLDRVDADTPPQLPGSLPRELTPFAQALQAGVERLRRALMRERRFASDVAHELRTPVAEIQTIAEAALPNTRDTAARAALTATLHSSRRMQRGIESLLTLVRIESGLEHAAADPFDLVALLRSLLEPAAARAAGRHLTLSCSAPDELWCRSDAGMLERLLTNLLDNALDYTPPGGDIHCHIWQTPHGVMLTLDNPAPELEAADLAHFGQRFWRRQGEAGNGPHTGLGLALCRALAEAIAAPLTFQLISGRLQVRLGPLPPL